MPNKDVLVRKAESRDLNSIKRLADQNRTALGFVLRPALAAGIEQRWIFIAEQPNGELIGFVHYRHRHDEQTTLHEICVVDAHRAKGVGRALVVTLVAESAELGKTRIQLKAPVDIPANAFYRAMGFALDHAEPGKRRPVNVWTYSLDGKNR